MSTLAFYAQFTKTLVGVNSLTVTWDVEQITRSDGTRSALVTGGATSITIGRRGLYGYLLASADTKLYDYVATAITAGDVDQKEIAALWTMYEADTLKWAGATAPAMTGDAFARIGAAGAGLTAVPWNAAWDAEVQSEAADALNAYDPPTNTEMEARTIPSASYFDPATDTVTPAGGQINSVSSIISANLVQMNGDTDPVDNLVLALGTGGLVEKLNSMLEAAGLDYRFTAEALAEAPSEAGSGTGTYTDTIKDPSNNPLDGARVQLSTDAAGTHRVYEAFTNALGVFTMNPDPGTYYRWIDLAGYTDRLTQGAQVTVT